MWEVCVSIEAHALHHPRRDYPMADGSQSLAWNPDQKNHPLLEPLAGCEVWTSRCFWWYTSPSLDLGGCCKLHQRPKHPCGMLRKCFGWWNQLHQEVLSFGAVQRRFLIQVSHFFWSPGKKIDGNHYCGSCKPDSGNELWLWNHVCLLGARHSAAPSILRGRSGELCGLCGGCASSWERIEKWKLKLGTLIQTLGHVRIQIPQLSIYHAEL